MKSNYFWQYIHCRKFLTLSNQTSRYKSKCAIISFVFFLSIIFCIQTWTCWEFFQKILSGKLSECQNSLDPDQAQHFDLVGTVCKDYLLKTLACKELRSGIITFLSRTPDQDFRCFLSHIPVPAREKKTKRTAAHRPHVNPWSHWNVKMMSPCRISAYSGFSGSIFHVFPI